MSSPRWRGHFAFLGRAVGVQELITLRSSQHTMAPPPPDAMVAVWNIREHRETETNPMTNRKQHILPIVTSRWIYCLNTAYNFCSIYTTICLNYSPLFNYLQFVLECLKGLIVYILVYKCIPTCITSVYGLRFFFFFFFLETYNDLASEFID